MEEVVVPSGKSLRYRCSVEGCHVSSRNFSFFSIYDHLASHFAKIQGNAHYHYQCKSCGLFFFFLGMSETCACKKKADDRIKLLRDDLSSVAVRRENSFIFFMKRHMVPVFAPEAMPPHHRTENKQARDRKRSAPSTPHDYASRRTPQPSANHEENAPRRTPQPSASHEENASRRTPQPSASHEENTSRRTPRPSASHEENASRRSSQHSASYESRDSIMRSPTMYDDGTTRTPREPDDEEEIMPAYAGAMRSRANSRVGTPNRVEDEEGAIAYQDNQSNRSNTSTSFGADTSSSQQPFQSSFPFANNQCTNPFNFFKPAASQNSNRQEDSRQEFGQPPTHNAEERSQEPSLSQPSSSRETDRPPPPDLPPPPPVESVHPPAPSPAPRSQEPVQPPHPNARQPLRELPHAPPPPPPPPPPPSSTVDSQAEAKRENGPSRCHTPAGNGDNLVLPPPPPPPSLPEPSSGKFVTERESRKRSATTVRTPQRRSRQDALLEENPSPPPVCRRRSRSPGPYRQSPPQPGSRTPGGGSEMPVYGAETPYYGGRTPTYGPGSTPCGARTPGYGGGQTPGRTPYGARTPGYGGGHTPGSTPYGATTPGYGGGQTPGSTPYGARTPGYGGGQTPGSTPYGARTPGYGGGPCGASATPRYNGAQSPDYRGVRGGPSSAQGARTPHYGPEPAQYSARTPRPHASPPRAGARTPNPSEFSQQNGQYASGNRSRQNSGAGAAHNHQGKYNTQHGGFTPMRSPGHYNDGSLRSPRMNGEDDEEELPAYRRSPGPQSGGGRTPTRASATDVRGGNSCARPPPADNGQGGVPSPGGTIPGGPFSAGPFGVPPPPPHFLGAPFPPGYPPPGIPWFGSGPMPNQFGMCSVPPWMGAMPGIPIFGPVPPPNFSAQPPPGQPIFGNPQPLPPPLPPQEPVQTTQASASTSNTGQSGTKTQPVVPPKPRERVGGSKFLDTAPPPPNLDTSTGKRGKKGK